MCGADGVKTLINIDKTRFTPTCVGQMEHIHNFFASARFTPTCVGQMTPPTMVGLARYGSPPRVWGRWRNNHRLAAVSCGSPPRVWGRFFATPPAGALWRFTPTCVGQMASFAGCPLMSAVHPHVCGADELFANDDNLQSRFTPTCVGQMNTSGDVFENPYGSPPRVWGR